MEKRAVHRWGSMGVRTSVNSPGKMLIKKEGVYMLLCI